LAANVKSDGRESLELGALETMFPLRVGSNVAQTNIFQYAPHPDGRFLVNVLEAGEPTINVITNWEKAVADAGSARR
jgi:hypothetical protein